MTKLPEVIVKGSIPSLKEAKFDLANYKPTSKSGAVKLLAFLNIVTHGPSIKKLKGSIYNYLEKKVKDDKFIFEGLEVTKVMKTRVTTPEEITNKTTDYTFWEAKKEEYENEIAKIKVELEVCDKKMELAKEDCEFTPAISEEYVSHYLIK